MNSRILLFTLLVILISSGGCKPKVKQDKRQEPVLTCAVAAGCKVVKLADGFRFILADTTWLLIRFSGTEPVLRIYAESDSLARVERLLELGKELAGV